MKEKIEVVAYKRGYRVTESGMCINPKGEFIGSVSLKGYYTTMIRINKKKVNFSIHRLQAFQKYGYKLFMKGVEVRHLNGNSLDNSWENVAIGTHSDNIMDIPKQIRIKKALYATSYVRKYNKQEVRDFYNSCKSYKQTMGRFKMNSKGTLHYILNS